MSAYEIPLESAPQQFYLTLQGVQYSLLVYWNIPANCWVLDLSAADGTLIIGSIPLVTGTDLLFQYRYLNIGGQLQVQSDVDLGAVPTFDNLGVAGHLFFIPD